MIFYAGGDAKYYPDSLGYTHKFTNFKEAMLFLWNKGKSPVKESQFKSFMKELLEV
jgi:hypothetical protein